MKPKPKLKPKPKTFKFKNNWQVKVISETNELRINILVKNREI